MSQDYKIFSAYGRSFGTGLLLCALFVINGAALAQSPNTLPLANPLLSGLTPNPTTASGGGLPVAPPETAAPTPSMLTAEIGAKPPRNGDPSSLGIILPSPPPPGSLSNDPAQLAAQAEQAAMQAQAQAEAEEARRFKEHNDKSFQRAESGVLPLSPDQVREFMHKVEQAQDASLSPYAGPPKAEVRIATLSLDPGAEPPVLNLSSGYVTTINMVDATGEPWPILDVGVGGNFEVTPTAAGSHVVRIMPLTRVGAGNLSVLLKDMPTPVIFKLNSGGATVDLRYDARIGKMGPGAKPPLIERPRLEAGNQTIMLVLANVVPSSAKRMKLAGLDERSMAWAVEGHVYLRTPLTLLSPAWDSSVSSADGMTVYEIGDAPVLLMSDNGAMVRARLLRDDDHDK